MRMASQSPSSITSSEAGGCCLQPGSDTPSGSQSRGSAVIRTGSRQTASCLAESTPNSTAATDCGAAESLRLSRSRSAVWVRRAESGCPSPSRSAAIRWSAARGADDAKSRVTVAACLNMTANVELSGHRRQGARPGLPKMYRVPPDRAWWPVVGAPLERRVRPRYSREGRHDDALLVLTEEALLSSSCPPSFWLWSHTCW